MQSLNLFLANWICLLDWIFQGSLQKISIPDGVTAVTRGSINIICSNFQDTVLIYKNNISTVNSANNDLAICYQGTCFPAKLNDYTFSQTRTTINISISNLSRRRDEMYWICISTAGQMSFLFLNISTIPQALSLTNILGGTDLAVADVKLQCVASCSYPEPQIQWFYTKDGQPAIWTNAGMQQSMQKTTGDTCKDSEKKHIAFLTLPRYTTRLSIAEFRCGITSNSFPGLNGTLFSTTSVTVIFAV